MLFNIHLHNIIVWEVGDFFLQHIMDVQREGNNKAVDIPVDGRPGSVQHTLNRFYFFCELTYSKCGSVMLSIIL